MINVEQTIISQYGASPTLLQLIRNVNLYIDPRDDIDNFFNYVWNVDTAQGFGLDIWGRIVGVERTINVPVGTPNPGGFPFTPGVVTLNDSEYRTLILFKALANIANCSSQNLNQLLSNLFAGRGRCYVRDLGAMTIEYRFEFWLQPYEYAIITQGIAPHPAGVLVKVYQVDVATTFGFHGTQLQPFNQGTFYNP